MGQDRIYHRPWFFLTAWGLVLLGIFLYAHIRPFGLVCAPILSLDPGASVTATCEGNVYTLEQADLTGQIGNKASATGQAPDGTVIRTSASNAVLTLTRTGIANNNVVAPNEIANVGDQIIYIYNVNNSGTVKLININISDPLLSGYRVNWRLILIDVFLILPLGMLIWIGFFAQFILPVQKFFDRGRIFSRLVEYLFGMTGAELFVEDGVVRESHMEREKTGDGVIWMDTASGGVIRNDVRFVRAIGPGVHFTSHRERLAGTVDLHTQMQALGPKGEDRVFDKQAEGQSEADFAEVQKRRKATSALTRDGIEVVPNITVLFRIDAKPVEGVDLPGSRFGYDSEAVFKAVTGRGVNAAAPADSPQRQVEWNQLPALLAVDLWREYLSRFTLNQLFEANQPPPPPAPRDTGPGEQAVAALREPESPHRNAFERELASLLAELNKLLARLLRTCQPAAAQAAPPPAGGAPGGDEPAEFQTALQVINDLVKDRLQKPEVDELDEFGRRTGRRIPSPEYRMIRDRGLKVISASAANLRFAQSIDEQLVRQWIATWLENARIARERLDRRRSLLELTGRETTVREYALALSHELIQNRAALVNARDAARALLARTRRELVRNDRLHRRLSTEIDELNEALRWLGREEQGE